MLYSARSIAINGMPDRDVNPPSFYLPDDTRPDGCECMWEDDEGHEDIATEHQEDNEKCPLNQGREEEEED